MKLFLYCLLLSNPVFSSPHPSFQKFHELKQLQGCLNSCVPGKDLYAKHVSYSKSKLELKQKECVESCRKPLASTDYNKETVKEEVLPLGCDKLEKESVDIQNKTNPLKNLICETKFTNYILTLKDGKKIYLKSSKEHVYSHGDFFYVKDAELFLFAMYERVNFSDASVYIGIHNSWIGTKIVHRASSKQLELKGPSIFSPSFKRMINVHSTQDGHWFMDIYQTNETDIVQMESIKIKNPEKIPVYFWVGEDKIIHGYSESSDAPEACTILQGNKWNYFENTNKGECNHL